MPGGFNVGAIISLGDMETALDYLHDEEMFKPEIDDIRAEKEKLIGHRDSTVVEEPEPDRSEGDSEEVKEEASGADGVSSPIEEEPDEEAFDGEDETEFGDGEDEESEGLEDEEDDILDDEDDEEEPEPTPNVYTPPPIRWPTPVIQRQAVTQKTAEGQKPVEAKKPAPAVRLTPPPVRVQPIPGTAAPTKIETPVKQAEPVNKRQEALKVRQEARREKPKAQGTPGETKITFPNLPKADRAVAKEDGTLMVPKMTQTSAAKPVESKTVAQKKMQAAQKPKAKHEAPAAKPGTGGINYDGLAVGELWSQVSAWIDQNGLRTKLISIKALEEQFGKKSVTRLVNQSYLISLGGGRVTCGR